MVEFRGRVHHLRVLDDLVQDGGRYAPRCAFMGLDDGWKNLIDSSSRFGGGEYNLGEIKEFKPISNFLLEILLLSAFSDRVPFIDDDHNALVCFKCVADDMPILVDDAVFRIDYQNGALTSIDRT